MQLKFLENYYQFPNEIKSYAYCQNVFRDMATEMQTRFSKGYQLLSALGKGNDFYEELSSLMDFLDEYCDEYSNKTTEVLNMMHRAGITNNVAYQKIENNQNFIIYKNDVDKFKKMLVPVINDFLVNLKNGENIARNNASASITGPGFGVLTSSIADAFIYDLVSKSAYDKQTKEAQKQYDASINQVLLDCGYESGKQIRNLFYECFDDFTISGFTSELMSVFLTQLESENKFNYSAVKNYNMEESQLTLHNFCSVKNDEALKMIKKAFVECPFNPEVYLKLLDFCIYDVETFKTANLLCVNKEIAQRVSAILRSTTVSMDDQEKLLSILEFSTPIEEQKKLRAEANKRLISDAAKVYQKYINIATCKDPKYTLQWLSSLSSNNVYEFVKECNEKSLEKIIVDDLASVPIEKDFDKLITTNEEFLGEIRLKNSKSTNLAEIKEELLNAVLTKVRDARKFKAERDALMIDYKNRLADSYDKLSHFDAERKNLGIFNVKRKKELNESIEQISNSIHYYEEQIEKIK